MVKREWTTMQAAIPRGLFLLLACAILGVVPRADASPFLLNLVASDSSVASGGSGGDQAGRLGLRWRNPDWRHPDLSGPESIYRGVGLSRMAGPTITRLLSGPSSPAAVGLIAMSKSSGRLAAASMADVASVGSAGLASVTQLNLGDGAYLSVSDSVGAALADNLSSAAWSSPVLAPPVLTPPDVLTAIGGLPRSDVASRPDTPTVANESNKSNNADVSGNNHDGQSGPSTDYNPVSPLPVSTDDRLADESVRAILTEISSGIISRASEQTDRAAGDFGAAANLVQNPEPATLILLASALVLTANRLRRLRH